MAEGSNDETPLCSYRDVNVRSVIRTVNAASIKDALKIGIVIVGPERIGITPDEVEARSLRAGGATALLAADVDTNTIQLLGRWKSDAMIRYLHVAASYSITQHARVMLQRGSTSFRPGTLVPMY